MAQIESELGLSPVAVALLSLTGETSSTTRTETPTTPLITLVLALYFLAMSEPRLVDSFTAPKEVLQEFAEMAEEEDIDPFAETAKQRQIAARQSDYHNRRFNRQAHDSADAFKAVVEGEDVEGGYKDAMRLQRLEKEEERVRRAIEEKERQERDGLGLVVLEDDDGCLLERGRADRLELRQRACGRPERDEVPSRCVRAEDVEERYQALEIATRGPLQRIPAGEREEVARIRLDVIAGRRR